MTQTISDRTKALDWWTLLTAHEKLQAVDRWKSTTDSTRKEWPFGLIARSTSTIEMIWKDTKEQQKKLLTEIMEADEKNGLYKQQTAVEWLLNYIERENWSLPPDVEELVKQMEKKQHRHTWLYEGDIDNASYERFERYYQVTFGGQGNPDTSPTK